MDATEKRLIDFVTRTLQLPGGPVSIFELVHVTDSENVTPIEPFAVGVRNPDGAVIAREILKAAGEHCEAFAMPQRYGVLAFREGAKNFSAQTVFLLRPVGNHSNAIGGATEPPTDRGIISQMMRHTEGAYATMIQLAHTVATMHEARGNVAERYFDKFLAERERWAGFDADREDRLAARQEAERDAAHERGLENTAVEELKPLFRQMAPHVARKVAGAVGLGMDDRGKSGGPARNAPKAGPEGAPSAAEQDENKTQGADNQTGEQNEKQDEPIDAKQAMRDALGEISPEEAEKLQEVLGPDKLDRIIKAAMRVSS